MTCISLALLILLALSIPLLIKGLRGRPIDNHPLCRQCGFDLTGRPSDSTNCAECGSDLRPATAIRIGHRRRNVASLVVGGSLFLLFLAGTGIVGLNAVEQVDWLRYEPAWLVIRQTDSLDRVSQKAAMTELTRRMTANELSQSNIDAIVSRALDIQGDRSKPWLTTWGNLIESARASNKLAAGQWQRYADQAAMLEFKARPKVRRGNRLPTVVINPASRVGDANIFWERWEAHDDGSDLAKLEEPNVSRSTMILSSSGSGSSGHEIVLDREKVAKAPDGQKTARLAVTEDIFENTGKEPDDGATPLVHKTLHLESPWELVAEGTATVTAIDDDSKRVAVEKSLRVTSLRVRSGYHRDQFVDLDMEYYNPPCPLAYEILLRADGRTWHIGSLNAAAGGGGSYGTGGSAKGLTAANVDVVFKPSLETAERTIDLTSFWNGEVVVKSVPVDYHMPATHP